VPLAPVLQFLRCCCCCFLSKTPLTVLELNIFVGKYVKN
jgi:hypothetical protein